MSDDGFFREVNEELRSDRVKEFWDRFGALIIGGAIALVLGTAGFVFYEYWNERKASQSGDQFLAALTLARDGKSDEALAALETLEKEGHGAYPVLARMRAATLLVQKGDVQGGIAAFDEVSKDNAVPQSIRDIARLRAALLLVDHGSYDDVAARAEILSADGNPMRHIAREAMGLAAWKAGRSEDATKLFQQIADDAASPANARQRANTMLDLIRSSGAAVAG
ncbi:MAG: tetratricopeptide repeat protein [Phyllobacterium sp.]